MKRSVSLLARRKEAYSEYILANPGTTPKEVFLAFPDLLTKQGRFRSDYETEYAVLSLLAKAREIHKERHSGRIFLYPGIPEHFELHGDNPIEE